MVKEPPLGTPEQAGLRIKSIVGIRVVSEPGFGAKEPPPGTPDQAGLRIKSFVGIKVEMISFGVLPSTLSHLELYVSIRPLKWFRSELFRALGSSWIIRISPSVEMISFGAIPSPWLVLDYTYPSAR